MRTSPPETRIVLAGDAWLAAGIVPWPVCDRSRQDDRGHQPPHPREMTRPAALVHVQLYRDVVAGRCGQRLRVDIFLLAVRNFAALIVVCALFQLIS